MFYNWTTEILISSAFAFTLFLDSRWGPQSTGIHYLIGGVLITDIRIKLLISVTLQEAPGAAGGIISCGNPGWEGREKHGSGKPHSPSGLFPWVQVGWGMGFEAEGVCREWLGILLLLLAPNFPSQGLHWRVGQDLCGEIIHRKQAQRINSSWTSKSSLGLCSMSGTCQDFNSVENSLSIGKLWPMAIQ